MTGHRKFSATNIPSEAIARARVERDEQDDAYARSLGEIRRARELTQQQLARALGVNQSEVSRIERRTDLFVSTLASYIEAMGGTLELQATFGDTEPVQITIGAIGRTEVDDVNAAAGEALADAHAGLEQLREVAAGADDAMSKTRTGEIVEKQAGSGRLVDRRTDG